MKLLWKLLRQHISIGQFFGFLFANLFGMIIVLTGYQFYTDVLPIFTAGDSFMKTNYMTITKHIGTGNTLSGNKMTFSARELSDIQSQTFINKVGAFTSNNYKSTVRMGINGQQILNSEVSFESIPDDFVQIDKSLWHFESDSETVPIIVPRNYINMYNFGFAQTHSLPQISEGLMGMIDIAILIRGNGKQKELQGTVVAFSSSVNSILVPQSFMDWSNNEFAPEEDISPIKLIADVSNPADAGVQKYFEQQGYDIENDKLEAEKTTYFLRLMVTMVVTIGIIISALSFYILMLSIFLLVQKNTDKLQNLLLIGYTATRVALPYQLLTIGLNAVVLLVSLFAVVVLRSQYMDVIRALYPESATGTLTSTFMLGILLFALVSGLNALIIKRKILTIR